MSLHPNQLAYQAGKSVEMALHQLVVWFEKTISRKQLWVFFLIWKGHLITPPMTLFVLH
jgi:hypothetical protein